MDAQKQQKSKSTFKKVRNIFLVILVLGLALFVGVRYYFPYGEGVKTGHLNYVVRKGIVFKTYEGKLIQIGIRSNSPGGIQSNEFRFSISDAQLADSLMKLGGQIVDLHYTEYFGALPWRGYSRFIVDGIVSVSHKEDSSYDYLPSADE